MNLPDDDQWQNRIYTQSRSPALRGEKDKESDDEDDEEFFDTSATMGFMKKNVSQALPKMENKLGLKNQRNSNLSNKSGKNS